MCPSSVVHCWALVKACPTLSWVCMVACSSDLRPTKAEPGTVFCLGLSSSSWGETGGKTNTVSFIGQAAVTMHCCPALWEHFQRWEKERGRALSAFKPPVQERDFSPLWSQVVLAWRLSSSDASKAWKSPRHVLRPDSGKNDDIWKAQKCPVQWLCPFPGLPVHLW